jgi:hypothetical protein
MIGAFVIATDSKFNEGQVVFMADRKIVGKDRWWTPNLLEAFIYRNEGAAQIMSKTLNFRNPRVMTLGKAREYATDLEVEWEGPGWDSHKRSFEC